ncbi:hypothetical protein [Bacillus sp. FSL K6-3431]|uniref:hypothetical protein n=1 Tax=Bacillus sp. FSL K6-3431 TaxID=2921500 RepID=UPI0030F71411
MNNTTTIDNIINDTRKKFGLSNYHLYRTHFFKKSNVYNEVRYTYSMEWFPNDVSQIADEDTNPTGTACIEYDLHNHSYESVIFVGGVSYAEGIIYKNNLKDVTHWIEVETGLRNEQDFHLQKIDEQTFYFQGSINGIPFSPSSTIEIRVDQNDKLTLFSIYGDFPNKDLVIEDNFTLTIDAVEQIAKTQLKLLEFPTDEDKQLLPIYGVEEIYIANKESKTLDFQLDERSRLLIDKTLNWETPLDKPFMRKQLEFGSEVTMEQAFSKEFDIDSHPITESIQAQCIIVVRDFLRQVYPSESGKWTLKSLHRNNGYIDAVLKLQVQNDYKIFQRKIIVMINGATLDAVNYIDNESFLEIYQDFTAIEPTVEHHIAYEELKPFITLTPVYVYDLHQEKYILCGKLDCEYGVHAATKEIIALRDI